MFSSQSIIIADPKQRDTFWEETTLYCSVLSTTPSPHRQTFCGPSRLEGRDRATIEAHYSEVRLEPYRETDGHGQGSGLSGEAESQFAGLRFARLAASQ